MTVVPRIRGRAGIAEDGPHKGKWFYEITVWDFTGEVQVGAPLQIGPFDSENGACAAGREAVRFACEAIEKDAGHEPDGKYLDMKNGGIMRPWENNS